MSIKLWVKTFNAASAGSDTRKNVLRMIVDDRITLSLENFGFIYHNTVPKNPFSYSVGPKQLIVKDENGTVCEKISFGKIEKMEVMKNENFEYIMLTVKK